MLKYILLCIVAFTGYYAWTIYPVKHGPGEIAPKTPEIQRVTWEKPFPFMGNTVKPVRQISGEVRVLKNKRYFIDSRSEVAPIDVLVGWKEMSDERNIDHLHFSLDNRYYEVNYSRPPLPLTEMNSQMALWHLMPSTEEIDQQIKRIRTGNTLKLKGLIVDLDSEQGFDWNSEIIKPVGGKANNLILWVTDIQVK